MGSRTYAANEAELPTGTLTKLFLESVDRYGDAPAFHVIRPPEEDGGEGGLDPVGYGEVLRRVRWVAGGLQALGLERGDRAAILSYNRLEWPLVDYGCLCAGVQLVPIYSTLTPAQVGYILGDSGAKVLFVSDEETLEVAREACDACEHEVRRVVFDSAGGTAEALSWSSFLETGRVPADAEDEESFRERALRARPDDVATMIYTSGTTGNPKGVMLTHQNLYSNVAACLTILDVGPDDRTLSFLPLSHVLQRMNDYLYFSAGCAIAHARSIDTVAEDLRITRPTKVTAVPRTYEKVYQKVMDQGGLRGRIVAWAAEVAERHAEARLAGRSPGPWLRARYAVADVLVFRKIEAGVGGRIEFFISGGAPLAPAINKFFYAAGITILEGYGLTETSPVTNVNVPERIKIGTVGPPVPGTEIRIAEDGEILVRGPQVMKGYFNRPEETAEAIDSEGWFRTGDIGELDDDGYLTITDRKKDLIVTAGGKNVAPQPIENRMKKSPFVDQVVMIGDQHNFVSVLVVPAFERLEGWARESGVEFSDREALLRDERAQERIEEEVFGELGDLAPYEMPKKIGLVVEPFTVGNGQLTPTEKVKRRTVEERYASLIGAFYREENRDRTVFVEGDR